MVCLYLASRGLLGMFLSGGLPVSSELLGMSMFMGLLGMSVPGLMIVIAIV